MHVLLAAGVLMGAMVAAMTAPQLAVPLLVGGLSSAVLGVRAAVQRHFLIHDLASERDSHRIPEVREVALRAASLAERRLASAAIRSTLEASGGNCIGVEPFRPELEELAAALVDERLVLDPVAAVLLDRMLREQLPPVEGPDEPIPDVRARLRRILCGFEERERRDARAA
jgi:hypothetical protein